MGESLYFFNSVLNGYLEILLLRHRFIRFQGNLEDIGRKWGGYLEQVALAHSSRCSPEQGALGHSWGCSLGKSALGQSSSSEERVGVCAYDAGGTGERWLSGYWGPYTSLPLCMRSV